MKVSELEKYLVPGVTVVFKRLLPGDAGFGPHLGVYEGRSPTGACMVRVSTSPGLRLFPVQLSWIIDVLPDKEDPEALEKWLNSPPRSLTR